MVGGISVRLQVAAEFAQKLFGTVTGTGWLVVIHHRRFFILLSRSVHPHVGFVLRLPSGFLQHLYMGFVRMQDVPLHQVFPDPLYQRCEVLFGTTDQPVCHGCSAQVDSHVMPDGLLPV